MAISMLKIRRPLGRLIFNMGIAIPGKTVFLIETAPWSHEVHVFHLPVPIPGNIDNDNAYFLESFQHIEGVLIFYYIDIGGATKYDPLETHLINSNLPKSHSFT